MNKTFYPFSIVQIPIIEKWLKTKAQKGFKLISYRFGVFVFERCQPKNREYFVFKESLGDKKMKFHGDFCMLKHLYAKRKTALNKRGRVVVEIDTRKIDSNYQFYRLARTQYYIHRELVNLLAAGMIALYLLALSFFDIRVLWFSGLSFVFVLKSLCFLFLLKKQKNEMKKQFFPTE